MNDLVVTSLSLSKRRLGGGEVKRCDMMLIKIDLSESEKGCCDF